MVTKAGYQGWWLVSYLGYQRANHGYWHSVYEQYLKSSFFITTYLGNYT